MPSPKRTSPNLARRRRLAGELRRLRERSGLSGEEACTILSWPANSKLSRIELGRSGIKPADLEALLGLYEVSEARRAELLKLAEESLHSGAVPAAADMPGEQVAFLESERDAEELRVWEPILVPGLLQVEGYTRSLAKVWADRFVVPGSEVDRLVEARRLRQQVLDGDHPRLLAVIDESVLSRRLGTADVMERQLRHIAEMSERPGIEVRVLPLDGPLPHLMPTGPFMYLRFRPIHAVVQPDLVGVETLTGTEYIDDESDVNLYRVTFDSLMGASMSASASRDRIAAAADRWQRIT